MYGTNLRIDSGNANLFIGMELENANVNCVHLGNLSGTDDATGTYIDKTVRCEQSTAFTAVAILLDSDQ